MLVGKNTNINVRLHLDKLNDMTPEGEDLFFELKFNNDKKKNRNKKKSVTITIFEEVGYRLSPNCA